MNPSPQIDKEAQNAIIDNQGKMTLRAYAASIKENAGYLSAVLNGKRPASNRLRVKLGLHPHMIEVPPCHKCGAVHLSKRCTAKDKPRTRQPDPVIRVKKLKRIIDGAPLSPEMKRELLALFGVQA